MKTKKQPSNKSKVIVAGDSIVNHVDQRKMSRSNTVKVGSFPGDKIEDIAPLYDAIAVGRAFDLDNTFRDK